jgi:hypothetical protein
MDTLAQAEADHLEQAARQLESDPAAPDRATRAQVAAQLRKAAAALRESGGNVQQANKGLQSAEQAMLDAAPQGSADASQTLSRIADALSADALTQSATQALDNQNAAAAAADLSQIASNVGSLSPQERDDLANALQSASNATRSADQGAADQLQQAADAARQGNTDGLQQAAQTIQQLGATSQAQRSVAQARSELQASREALNQASGGSRSSGQTSNQSGDSSASDQPGSQSGQGQDSASPGSDIGYGQPSTGTAPGTSSQNDSSSDNGGGIGKGSADHLGAPHDLQGLAERQVVVPTDPNGQPGSIGLSNQRQTGAGGTAQVDYANVLPQYRTQALQNIEGNVVPTGLKQVVKGYFDSLSAK